MTLAAGQAVITGNSHQVGPFTGQCDQIWRNSATLADISKYYISGLFGFGQSFQLNLALTVVCFWASFHCCKGPNIENTIWSHCPLVSGQNLFETCIGRCL